MRASCERPRHGAATAVGGEGDAVGAGVPIAVRALLLGAIDYAGLFPPASLPMEQAVANYAAYRASRHGWALGRFIVPIARLEEFMVVWAARAGSHRWRLSALAEETSPASDIVKVVAFNQRHRKEVLIDAVEFGPTTTLPIEEAVRLADGRFVTFHEIPLAEDPRQVLHILARAGGRAKIRTGGVTAEAFPDPVDLARFIQECNTARVAFKATAGLHHALRGWHHLTAAADAGAATMHGFLNLLLAAAFARTGWHTGQLAAVIAEQSPGAFRLDEEGASWLGHRLSTAVLKATRAEFLYSFGSCSFDEPMAEMAALGWLPA